MTLRVWCFRCDCFRLCDADSKRCVTCNVLSWELLAIAARDGTAADNYSPPKRTRYRGKKKRDRKGASGSPNSKPIERNVCAC